MLTIYPKCILILKITKICRLVSIGYYKYRVEQTLKLQYVIDIKTQCTYIYYIKHRFIHVTAVLNKNYVWYEPNNIALRDTSILLPTVFILSKNPCRLKVSVSLSAE